MKLTKSEAEKLVIALFKLARMKPTIEIGEKAAALADLIDAEEARKEAAENAKQIPLPLQTEPAQKK